MRYLQQAIGIAVGVVAPLLLYWIAHGSILLAVQKMLGLQPFSIFWGGPIWPLHIAVPAYFVASLGGVAAVHIVVARSVRHMTNFSSLAVVILVNLFLFPLGVFGVYKSLFPAVGTFGAGAFPYLLAFMVLIVAPYLSFVDMQAERRSEKATW